MRKCFVQVIDIYLFPKIGNLRSEGAYSQARMASSQKCDYSARLYIVVPFESRKFIHRWNIEER